MFFWFSKDFGFGFSFGPGFWMLVFLELGLGYFKDFGLLVFRIPDDVKVYPQRNVYKSNSARLFFISIYCTIRKTNILYVVLTAIGIRKPTNADSNCYLPVNCGLNSGAFFNFRATELRRISLQCENSPLRLCLIPHHSLY